VVVGGAGHAQVAGKQPVQGLLSPISAGMRLVEPLAYGASIRDWQRLKIRSTPLIHPKVFRPLSRYFIMRRHLVSGNRRALGVRQSCRRQDLLHHRGFCLPVFIDVGCAIPG
jgi:hypothetical protein